MSHACHAIGCEEEVPPAKLACPAHWAMIPKPLRDQVWGTYHPGQEQTKETTPEYRQAAARAIVAIAEREGRAIPPIWRRMATGQEE